MNGRISVKNGSTPATYSAMPDPRLPIYSVTPFTMLDFPGRTACIVWLSGCNMRCAYCHNPQIVMGKGRDSAENILSFLKKRQGLLDGVVLSGGEASIWPGLTCFIQDIKALGYAVKLDTNGLRPNIVQDFIQKGLIDYVALDYKAPPDKFKAITGVKNFKAFSKTLDILCTQNHIPFEIRTTVHTDLVDEEDISAIIHDLDSRGYKGGYYVQNFRAHNGQATLGFLSAQSRMLDINKLPNPENFTLSFRNFDS